jgi:hypothetical protein
MVPLCFYLLETNDFMEKSTNLAKKAVNLGKNSINSKISFEITQDSETDTLASEEECQLQMRMYYTVILHHKVSTLNLTQAHLAPLDVNLQEGSHRKQILPSSSLWLFPGL